MRKLFALAMIAAGALSSLAGTKWTISNVSFSVDTLYHATVGPGITETELRVTCDLESNPYKNLVYYTTIDLTNQYNDMRVVTAYDSIRGLESPGAMLKRKNQEMEAAGSNIKYIAGTNGDFFNTTDPKRALGYTVIDGVPAYDYLGGYSSFTSYFSISNKKVPTISEVVTIPSSGTIEFTDGTERTFYINTSRLTDYIVLYNKYFGKSTQTNIWGAEVPVKIADNGNMMGGMVDLEVTGTPESYVGGASNGNMTIPDGGMVLSAVNNNYSYIKNLKVGDRVSITLPCTLDGKLGIVNQMVGGTPVILKDGVVCTDNMDKIDHLKSRQPRTAIGYNADKTKVMMLVDDGRRSGISEGYYASILAEVMRNIGCVDALNLDGGGSSQMYIAELGLRNLPTGSTYQRPVANGIFAVSTAPADNEIASIEFMDKVKTLNPGDEYTPTVYGYNKYGVLISADVKDFTLSAPAELGTISGTKLTASGIGTYALTATYGTATTSIPVTVTNDTGVNTVGADDDTPAEYYNLQGMRITNPEKGQIVIVRRGHNVAKKIY